MIAEEKHLNGTLNGEQASKNLRSQREQHFKEREHKGRHRVVKSNMNGSIIRSQKYFAGPFLKQQESQATQQIDPFFFFFSNFYYEAILGNSRKSSVIKYVQTLLVRNLLITVDRNPI